MNVSDEMKICRVCKTLKLLECFRVDREYVRGECRECEAAERKSYYAKNPEKACAAARKWTKEHPAQHAATKKAWRQKNPAKQDAYARKTHYGITDLEFQSLLVAQGGLCAICGGPPTRKRRSLSVDHCHVTGKVRGLLCGYCNAGLANFKDTQQLFFKAINYLRRFRS